MNVLFHPPSQNLMESVGDEKLLNSALRSGLTLRKGNMEKGPDAVLKEWPNATKELDAWEQHYCT